jgi:dTDP-4-amino-4,6-dideoxygalactose transaminase
MTRHTPPADPLALRAEETIGAALARLAAAGAPAMIAADPDGRPAREVRPVHLRRMLRAGFAANAPLSALPPAPVATVAAGATAAEAQAAAVAAGLETVARVDADGRMLRVEPRDRTQDRLLLSPPHMGGEEEELVADAFDSNWIAPLGPHVDGFEAELAARAGVPAVAALSSGTAALHLALRLLGVGPGDVVPASSLTFIGSIAPILYLGATPMFVDSDPETWNMCPRALARALAALAARGVRPKAVIATSLYGQAADLDALAGVCAAAGAALVEDAAESLGARYKDRFSGGVAAFSAFSFNGNKIITTSGGGALAGLDPEAIARARFLSTQARDPAPHYQHTTFGYNYRLSNLLAAVGRAQLARLDERIAARRAIFARYRERLADVPGLGWMPEAPYGQGNRWLSVATLDPAVAGPDAPARAIAALAAAGIEARPVWKPMHRQPLFADAAYVPWSEDRSVSDDCFDHGLCLPSGSAMTEGQVDRVAAAVRAALR